MVKPEKKSYIYIHSDFLDLLDRLTKKDGYFSDGNHLIRFAISLGLSAKGKLTPKMLGQLRREDGARNFDSEKIDENGQITFLIDELVDVENGKTMSKLEELANVGFNILQKKYIDTDNLIIDWDKISKDLK